MRIVTPYIVNAGQLTTTNVVNSEADWSAGTYDLGDQAVDANQVYKVVADPTTTDQPTVGAVADPPTWVLMGWSTNTACSEMGAISSQAAMNQSTLPLTFRRLLQPSGHLACKAYQPR